VSSSGERFSSTSSGGWVWTPLAAEHYARYQFARDAVAARAVVEVACGTGYGTSILAAAARSVRGFDFAPEAIAIARKSSSQPNVSFSLGDICDMPFESGTVEAVVSLETIEHVPQPQLAVREIARILRRGGTAVISTPDREIYNWADHRTDGGNPFHLAELSRNEFTEVLEGQFASFRLYGQVLVPSYGVIGGAADEFASPGRSRRLAKAVARAMLRPVFRSRHAEESFARLVRPDYYPTPIDSRPWKYLVAVATR
jgi:ubiquinone/menaquinone biosynthesis C-methylase UbiE